ncbi:MAG: hypothetical protein JSV61_14015 [Anaerolineales bacterium]|nr:MAG: hypothetical protein JSV61_14015 [Anaerolineales bacterium]
MSAPWIEDLRLNPLPALLSWRDPALNYFTRRDLLEEQAGPVEKLWGLPSARKIINRQQADGSWRYPGKGYNPKTGTNYTLLETYRQLRLLVEMYGLQREHACIQIAADYVFTCQAEEGDIRGILGNQHMPYYHGAILELIVKAGYANDPRLEKGLEWLLSVRQADGGWVVPTQAVPSKQRNSQYWLGKPIKADSQKASSHLATGMALRAFTAHSRYHQNPEVIAAANFLKGRLFRADAYTDRKAPSYWLKFQYPFWWTNLLTALDSLSRLGYSPPDEQLKRGIDWFLTNQSEDGLWETGYGSGGRAGENRHWVGLAICRVLKRLII